MAAVTRQHSLQVALVLLVFSCQGADGFLQVITGSSVTDGHSITVPNDGVYLVSVVADPGCKRNSDMRMRIAINESAQAAVNEGINDDIMAYGNNYIVGGLTLAMPLKAGDTVRMLALSKCTRDSVCRLSVAYVTSDPAVYYTYRSVGDDGVRLSSHDIYWSRQLSPDGSWRSISAYTEVSLSTGGIYWLAVRPDSDDPNPMTFSVSKQSDGTWFSLFNVYCDFGYDPRSTAGAFYFSNQKIRVWKVNKDQHLGRATFLSAVRLTNNVDTSFRFSTYVAFTAFASTGTLSHRARLTFSERVRTNYGQLFDYPSKQFKTRDAGMYAVSIRGDPGINGETLNLLLIKNGTVVFSAYSERGVPSGQTGIFYFEQDAIFHIAMGNADKKVDMATMMSIAFIASQ